MDVAKHNMEYLNLNKKQYAEHCELMATQMSEYPQKLKDYIERESKKYGACGDAIACWVADYVRGDVK